MLKLRVPSLALGILFALAAPFAASTFPAPQAQKPAPPNKEKVATPGEGTETPKNPAQIELLETHIRFEADGSSRKEVHTRVHINTELGVNQFARLNFDFNRSFEQIDIPFVRITHASGGTSDILPSAITDNPNPAVVNAPAYQDVRVKSIRILGLTPGDTLEYRVITTVHNHPLAPDFWLDHSFDHTGVVSHEIFELDLPAVRPIQIHINPATAATSTDKSGEGDVGRTTYRWDRPEIKTPDESQLKSKELSEIEPDITLSTLGWDWLSIRLDEKLTPGAKPLETAGSVEESMQELSHRGTATPEITAKAIELTRGNPTNKTKIEAIYNFVSQRITTVDLPLGATGFSGQPASEVLAAGYAIPEDKFVLFAALADGVKLRTEAALTGYCNKDGVARTSVFNHLLISVNDGITNYWLDPSLEVAPFGMISAVPQKCAFVMNRGFYVMNSTGHEWQPLDRKLPFAARQKVEVDASLTASGKLTAKVHYSLRGDNELLLRVAFHQTPKEKWNDLGNLLAISDGFRGQVTGVTASDPYATREPFTVDYEITVPKFVDWSKKPVRIPALLPQVGLPDPPAKPAAGSAVSPIELGTPLDVQTQMTLQLPPGTTAHTPTGTAVDRDYATFSSSYSAKGLSLTASRHLNFLAREVPAARLVDYNAFLRAVQSDSAQDFTLERAEPPAPQKKPAEPVTAAPPVANPPKP